MELSCWLQAESSIPPVPSSMFGADSNTTMQSGIYLFWLEAPVTSFASSFIYCLGLKSNERGLQNDSGVLFLYRYKFKMASLAVRGWFSAI